MLHGSKGCKDSESREQSQAAPLLELCRGQAIFDAKQSRIGINMLYLYGKAFFIQWNSCWLVQFSSILWISSIVNLVVWAMASEVVPKYLRLQAILSRFSC